MGLFNKKKTDATEMIGRSLGQETWRRLRKNKGAMMGIAFIILLFIGTALATIFYDYDKDIIGMTRDRFMAPNWKHPFGTDNMGRDIFARVIYGAKYSLLISFGATIIGLIVGLFLGAAAGYYGGLVDNIIMRVADIFYSIPYIMIAVVVVSILGTSMSSLLFAMALGSFCGFARISRASVMTVRDQEFVEAGRAIGLTLTPTNLMVPRKSITAVLGISSVPKPDIYGNCIHCPLQTKCTWAERGERCYQS